MFQIIQQKLYPNLDQKGKVNSIDFFSVTSDLRKMYVIVRTGNCIELVIHKITSSIVNFKIQ